MIRGLRHHLGLGRRSRRLATVVAWLCFCIAAMPCAAATTACCPDAPTPETETHGSHADHHVTGSVEQGSLAHGTSHHDCQGLERAGCCEAQLPTLEDRSPPVPEKPADLANFLNLDWAVSAVTATGACFPATGPPPDASERAVRRHALLCTFLN